MVQIKDQQWHPGGYQQFGPSRQSSGKRILAAIYPKPRLSLNGTEHKVYPYLLKGLAIDAPDQAWATDISVLQQR
jgi:hypothetical protein